MSNVDFSSWPREQEATFVVYEQRAAESQQKAWTFGAIISAVVFVFALGVYFGVTPEENDISKDMNMSNLTKKEGAAAAPAADAEKSE